MSPQPEPVVMALQADKCFSAVEYPATWHAGIAGVRLVMAIMHRQGHDVCCAGANPMITISATAVVLAKRLSQALLN